MHGTRQITVALAAGLLCCLAGGCSLAPAGGMADRCADIVQRAYPGADIDVFKREAAATSITTIVAKVEGWRRDLPPDTPLPRDLKAECRFDNSVMTGFQWTKGPT